MGRLKEIWEFLSKPKVYWRLFSLVLAIIFWLLAAGDGSLGGTERVITLDVELQNLPADLVVVERPDPVKVRIRGLAPILNRGEEGIRAKINLTDGEQGTKTYGVEVESPAGIEVVSVTPRWISVVTEEIAREIFPVTVALLGIEPTNVITVVNPVPAVVTVMGPNSILNRVDHVVAYVTLGIDQLDREVGFPVQALDAQGRSLTPLEINPPKIQVHVEQKDPVGEE